MLVIIAVFSLALLHLDRGLIPAGALLGGFLASTLDPAMAKRSWR